MKKFRSFVICVAICVMSGCALTRAVYVDVDRDEPLVNVAVLTSKADDRVKVTVVEQCADEFDWQVGGAMLEEVDGMNGASQVPRRGKLFNGPMSGSFRVVLNPGTYELLVSPSYCRVRPEERVLVTVPFEQGHEYYVGTMFKVVRAPSTFGFNGVYEWKPMVVDTTTMDVLVPEK